MTIVKNHREYTDSDGLTWFVEQYADKPSFVWLWRYGYNEEGGLGHIVSDALLSRPVIKRIINL